MKTLNHRTAAYTALLFALGFTGACSDDPSPEPEGAAGSGLSEGARTGTVPLAGGVGVIDYDRCAEVTSRFDEAEDAETDACAACCLPAYHVSRFVDKHCACAYEDLPPNETVCADSAAVCDRCCEQAGYDGSTSNGVLGTCTCSGTPVMPAANDSVCAWVVDLPNDGTPESCSSCCLDSGYISSGWGAAFGEEPASCTCQ